LVLNVIIKEENDVGLQSGNREAQKS